MAQFKEEGVADFYAEKSIFITGGTGFLGKLFFRLHRDDPSALKKVVPVAGDLTMPNLGLSEAVESLIASNAFVHVSTAYTNTDQKVVEERVYPPPAPLSEVYEFVRNYGDDKDATQKLLNERPNTYNYTKALAEDLVLKEHGGIPTAIIRPSIVLSVLREPIPGWLDNWFGPTGLLYVSSQGMYCSMLGSGSNLADLVPVDIVTNLMIVAASRCKNPFPIFATFIYLDYYVIRAEQ